MYLENRMIAMLDVLGLSPQLTTRADLEATAEKYKKLILEAKSKVFNPQTMPGSLEPEANNFEIGEFVFDNLVLVSYPLTPESASKFIMALILLMQKFALQHMPLRGAIGIGDYQYDPETNVFLSNIFKTLNKEEQKQEWAGCILLEKDSETIVDLVCGLGSIQNQKQSSALIKIDVPSKPNCKLGERWCLNWMHLLNDRQQNFVFEFLAGDRNKHDGVKYYLENLKQLPAEVTLLPPEFFPATRLEIMKTRGTARVCFYDKDGEPTEPGLDKFDLYFTEEMVIAKAR